MSRIFIAIYCLIVCAGFNVTAAQAITSSEVVRQFEAMDWYTEEYPPYNFVGEDGVPSGIAVDILMAAFKRMNVNVPPSRIKIVPWADSYVRILRNPGTALFSMTYTPERLKFMKIIGPSVQSSVSIIALKKNKVSIKSEADLRRLMVGVIRDDIGDQLVRKFAISDSFVIKTKSVEKLTRLLLGGRVDVVVYATEVFNHAVKRFGGNVDDYESVYTLQKGKMGYAFHEETDIEVLNRLQSTIDAMWAEGIVDKITNKYRE